MKITRSLSLGQYNNLLNSLYRLSNDLYSVDTNIDSKVNEYLTEEEKEIFDEVKSELGVGMLDVESVKKIIEEFEKSLRAMPQVTIQIAYEPTVHDVESVIAFFNSRLDYGLVVNMKINPEIVGGAVVEFNGKYNDYSIKGLIDEVLNSDLGKSPEVKNDTSKSEKHKGDNQKRTEKQLNGDNKKANDKQENPQAKDNLEKSENKEGEQNVEVEVINSALNEIEQKGGLDTNAETEEVASTDTAKILSEKVVANNAKVKGNGAEVESPQIKETVLDVHGENASIVTDNHHDVDGESKIENKPSKKEDEMQGKYSTPADKVLSSDEIFARELGISRNAQNNNASQNTQHAKVKTDKSNNAKENEGVNSLVQNANK